MLRHFCLPFNIAHSLPFLRWFILFPETVCSGLTFCSPESALLFFHLFVTEGRAKPARPPDQSQNGGAAVQKFGKKGPGVCGFQVTTFLLLCFFAFSFFSFFLLFCFFVFSLFRLFTFFALSLFHIFTFSHFHIFTFSHFHIFTFSHFHIFTFSHFQGIPARPFDPRRRGHTPSVELPVRAPGPQQFRRVLYPGARGHPSLRKKRGDRSGKIHRNDVR